MENEGDNRIRFLLVASGCRHGSRLHFSREPQDVRLDVQIQTMSDFLASAA